MSGSELLGQIVSAIVKGSAQSPSTLNKTISLYDCQELKKSIERVEEQNNRIIAAHLKAADDHLRYAQKAANLTNRRKYLENAKDEFIQASHVADSPYGSAHAKMMVAICFWFLGEKENALDASVEAYNVADEVRKDLSNSINNPFFIFQLDALHRKKNEVGSFMIAASNLLGKLEGSQAYYVKIDGKRRKLKPSCTNCGWKTIIERSTCPLCREDIVS
jgi:hypothetical protein